LRLGIFPRARTAASERWGWGRVWWGSAVRVDYRLACWFAGAVWRCPARGAARSRYAVPLSCPSVRADSWLSCLMPIPPHGLIW